MNLFQKYALLLSISRKCQVTSVFNIESGVQRSTQKCRVEKASSIKLTSFAIFISPFRNNKSF